MVGMPGFWPDFDQFFDQIFGQVFDQIFGQVFDQFVGVLTREKTKVQCTYVLVLKEKNLKHHSKGDKTACTNPKHVCNLFFV